MVQLYPPQRHREHRDDDVLQQKKLCGLCVSVVKIVPSYFCINTHSTFASYACSVSKGARSKEQGGRGQKENGEEKGKLLPPVPCPMPLKVELVKQAKLE